jgi:ribosome-binding protein aMBF1 (putative translation factor)
MKTFREMKAELMQDPEFQAEYEQLCPEFELAETIIAARAAQGLTQAELAARMNTSQSSMFDARIEATQETGIEIQRFPSECPWTADAILDPAWKPAG